MPGLLEGVRVLDLTHYIAGPYCTRLFGTLGADVIKVERPESGDPARQIGPFPTEVPNSAAGATFLYLNCSKKSVTLNLKEPGGRRILTELARSAHVLVENFSPRVLPSLGLGYEELAAINPPLVMTSISNYGQTGPYRDWRAVEMNLYALGGLMNITGEPDRAPLMEGAPLAQLGAGQNAFVASMTALLYAEETGQGQHVDVSIAEYATNILENALMQYSYSGQEFERVGNRGYGRAAWGIYPCRDGYVGVIAGPDHRWPGVAELMDCPELGDEKFATRYGRLVNADEAEALMLPWLLEHDKADIFVRGQERGLAFAYVATLQDILEMEQLADRHYFVELDHPIAGSYRYPGPPVRPSEPAWVYRRAPLLGEHNHEVLGGLLGYSAEGLDELERTGVI